MSAQVISAAPLGVDAACVHVEAQIVGIMRRFTIVGLPDSVVKESKERVRCAIENSGLVFPLQDLVVSLGPASLPKIGAGLDVAIALSILVADAQLTQSSVLGRLFLGELALNGDLRSAKGTLASLCLARELGISEVFLPANCSSLACLVPEVQAYAVENLAQVVAIISGDPDSVDLSARFKLSRAGCETKKNMLRPIKTFDEVIGQEHAKRAMEIVAAGGHNILMVGPPGCGKSMLAERVISILPKLEPEEAIEVGKIYSSAYTDTEGEYACLDGMRPYRDPHHSTSLAGLIGGGSYPRPGEISLAHRGVLFLDELGEFRSSVLESLRQPLESQRITISRAKQAFTFPADFILAAAMNPPRDTEGRGFKADYLVRRALSSLSRPLVDRLDLQIWLPPIPVSEILAGQSAETGTYYEQPMNARVNFARELQMKRFGNRHKLNARMTVGDLARYCLLPARSKAILEKAAAKWGFTARGINRVLKVSRTIADLAGSEELQPSHVAESLSYRMAENSNG